MIHKEGYTSIAIVFVFVLLLNFVSFNFFVEPLQYLVYGISIFLLLMVLQFFRNPSRTTIQNVDHIIAPADGKVVVIEEVEENEYFKDRRLQVSIFMSPINVHCNRYPIGGKIEYVKYHPGAFLVAWHPKSSTENERTTLVVTDSKNRSILFRQIAGALAKRIVWYAKEGGQAVQGEQFGFIKFGSRVDLFLPIGTQINVKLNQAVRGGETVLGSFIV